MSPIGLIPFHSIFIEYIIKFYCFLYHNVIYLYHDKLKTKWFKKWAKRNKVKIADLNNALEALKSNLSTSDLGSGLFKVRVPKPGKGKSGGFRTLIVFEKKKKLFFVFGFSKNEKENLEKDELRYFKTLANDLLKLNEDQIKTLVNIGELFNLED